MRHYFYIITFWTLYTLFISIFGRNKVYCSCYLNFPYVKFLNFDFWFMFSIILSWDSVFVFGLLIFFAASNNFIIIFDSVFYRFGNIANWPTTPIAPITNRLLHFLSLYFDSISWNLFISSLDMITRLKNSF